MKYSPARKILGHIAGVLVITMLNAVPAFSADTVWLWSYGVLQEYQARPTNAYVSISMSNPPEYDIPYIGALSWWEGGGGKIELGGTGPVSWNVTYDGGLHISSETNYSVSLGKVFVIQHDAQGAYVANYWAPLDLVGGGMTNLPTAGSDLKPSGDTAATTEPVNTISGNLYFNETDAVIPCPGISLASAREYGSLGKSNSYAGNMWSHSYDWFLFDTNAVVDGQTNSYKAVKTGSGETFKFLVTNGVYQTPADTAWRLEFTNQAYRLGLGMGVVYEFDSNGVLQVMSDAWSNRVTLSYTNAYPSNQLIKAEHGNGQYLSFTYTNNRLAQISTPVTNFYINFAYDASGCLTGTVRHVGTNSYSCRYAYDTWLTQRVNSAGDVFSYGYETNGSGRGTEVSVGSNYYHHVIDFATSGMTRVTYYRDSGNQCYCYAYDTNSLRLDDVLGPAADSNSPAQGIKYRYDAEGNVTNEYVLSSDWTEFSTTIRNYDGFHNPTNIGFGFNSQPSNFLVCTWDTNWQVMTSITDPEGHKAEMEYTNASVSRLKLYYDASNSYDTLFSYTTNGLLSSVTNASGHSVNYYYNSYGYLTSAVPQAGPVFSYGYSTLGFLTNIIMPSDNVDSNNNPIARNVYFNVNELGWINKITHADSSYETFSYDSEGNITNMVDTAGRSTRYTYLPTRKLSSVTKSLGTTNITTSLVYDSQFNTLRITDAKGRDVETYSLDIEDRPVTITNLEGRAMSISYGLDNHVKCITNFDGTTVSNSYNSDGLLSAVSGQSFANSFGYYKNGALKTAQNEAGTISNEFNFANRLSSQVSVPTSGESGSVPSVVSYSYFPAGQVSNVVSVAGTNTYSLDAADRISTLTAGLSGLSNALGFNWNYNSNNGLVQDVTSTNSGISVSHTYDTRDRITGMIWRNAGNEIIKRFIYTYNSAGMISDVQYETGEYVHYNYDSLDRLTQEKQYNAACVLISDEGYGYDEVGNRTSKDHSGIAVSYSYPYGTNGNRLTGWSVTSTNLSAYMNVYGCANEDIGTNPHFGQLWVSNTTAVTPFVEGTNFWVYDLPVNLGTQQVTAAIRDQAGNTTFITNTVLISIVTNGSYLHNSAGCVTNITYTGSGFSENIGLSWDSKYQLTAVSTNGSECERNGYDALGRRVWNWNGTETNYFVYDGQQIIADVDSTGGLRRAYVWGPGIDNLLAMTVYTGATVKTYFALTDHLRSVHAMVDESGAIVEQYRMDAWGRTTVYDGDGVPLAQSGIGNRYVWQGREISWATGLYYFRFRVFDPVSGRFLSNDPIGISGGLNMYILAGNCPTMFRDPFGLKDGREWSLSIIGGSIACGLGITAELGITRNAEGEWSLDLTWGGGIGAYIGLDLPQKGVGKVLTRASKVSTKKSKCPESEDFWDSTRKRAFVLGAGSEASDWSYSDEQLTGLEIGLGWALFKTHTHSFYFSRLFEEGPRDMQRDYIRAAPYMRGNIGPYR